MSNLKKLKPVVRDPPLGTDTWIESVHKAVERDKRKKKVGLLNARSIGG